MTSYFQTDLLKSLNQQKGFSLIEVLVSLMLLTTLGVALLEQQGQTRQLLTQLALRTKASQFLDQVDESLFIGVDKLPAAPFPYHFMLQKNKQNFILRLDWLKDFGSIIREHSAVGVLK